MSAGDLIALAIVSVGIAAGCVVVGRLIDRVQRVIDLIERHVDTTRAETHRLDTRMDDLHRQIGRLDVIAGGRGRGGNPP